MNAAGNSLLMLSISGVLAASLDRSRQKWLTEGILEKYWTKPSKKKVQIDVQNPAKESMVKLGICSMIIEPHVFEITLYTVREIQPNFVPTGAQSSLAVLPHHAAASFGAPYSNPAQQSQLHQTSSMPPPFQPSGQQSSGTPQPILPPFREGFAQFELQGLSPAVAAPQRPIPISSSQSLPATQRVSQNAVQTQDSTANPDPVIQMLAARAATDHDLKSLMRVVASGKASQSQLRVFQNHIDELNGIIQAQKNLPQPNPTQPNSLPPGIAQAQTGPESIQKAPSTNSGELGHSLPPTPLPAGTTLPPVKTEPLSQYYSQAPQPLKSKTPMSVRQDISAIVFDFTGGTGDRYLIPKNSIIEYLPGNTQVLVSFLITRKGSTAVSGTYQAAEDYYEPVTIRLSTLNPRTLEPLARVVAPLEEVRKYMNDVMDKMTPAGFVHLATQLPRTNEGTSLEKKDPYAEPDPDMPRPYYPPPDTLLPLRSAANR